MTAVPLQTSEQKQSSRYGIPKHAIVMLQVYNINDTIYLCE